MKIEINKISKTYDRSILNINDFYDEVDSLAIIGKSGCGKSTLLRILGGLIDYDGHAKINGHNVKEHVDYRKRIGFVFQRDGLFTHMSAKKNITFPLIKVHNYDKDEAEKIALDLLDRFGLSKEIDKLPHQLSGGQRQRVAIARAVAPKPTILLLDEPTSALDPEYTAEVLDVINELKKDNISFIIATHEMNFAKNSCDKVAFISEGEIVEYKESTEFFSNPTNEVTRQFLSKMV